MHVLFRYWMTRMCIAVSVPATIKVRHVWSHLSVQCQWGWMMAGTRYSLTCPTLHAERMEPTTSKHSVFRYLLPSQRNMNILECSACCFTHETLCFYFSIFCRRQGVIRLLIDNLFLGLATAGDHFLVWFMQKVSIICHLLQLQLLLLPVDCLMSCLAIFQASVDTIIIVGNRAFNEWQTSFEKVTGPCLHIKWVKVTRINCRHLWEHCTCVPIKRCDQQHRSHLFTGAVFSLQWMTITARWW